MDGALALSLRRTTASVTDTCPTPFALAEPAREHRFSAASSVVVDVRRAGCSALVTFTQKRTQPEELEELAEKIELASKARPEVTAKMHAIGAAQKSGESKNLKPVMASQRGVRAPLPPPSGLSFASSPRIKRASPSARSE